MYCKKCKKRFVKEVNLRNFLLNEQKLRTMKKQILYIFDPYFNSVFRISYLHSFKSAKKF
jgi:hypothetical protein